MKTKKIIFAATMLFAAGSVLAGDQSGTGEPASTVMTFFAWLAEIFG